MIRDDTQTTPDEQVDEVAQWKQKYLRALADYQNLEKRTIERLHTDSQMAARKTVERLLPVIDILYKAQEALQDKGLELAIKQFEDALRLEGVSRLQVIDTSFDPVTMECIELAGESGDDTVIEELRAGYTMHDIVIRPAQVKVGKKKKTK